jgi:hypothetical protein
MAPNVQVGSVYSVRRDSRRAILQRALLAVGVADLLVLASKLLFRGRNA